MALKKKHKINVNPQLSSSNIFPKKNFTLGQYFFFIRGEVGEGSKMEVKSTFFVFFNFWFNVDKKFCDLLHAISLARV